MITLPSSSTTFTAEFCISFSLSISIAETPISILLFLIKMRGDIGMNDRLGLFCGEILPNFIDGEKVIPGSL